MGIRYAEFFAGIGGFRYGLEKAGNFKCVYANEWDKYACQIYRKNFGDKELYEGDITKITAKSIPDFDLLVGGFPCQTFSIAGKRKGFRDTRGTLFFDLCRITEAKKPNLLLLENVKGLLNHDSGNTFRIILDSLSELGYDCEWEVLNSKNFGVPQNRERVFIIGHLRGTGGGQVFPIGEDGECVKKMPIGSGWTKSKTAISGCIGVKQDREHNTFVANPKVIVSGTLNSEKWVKRHESIRRGYDTKGISPTIPTGTGGGVMPKINQPATIDLYHFLHGEKRPPTSRIMDDGNSATISAAQPPHLINDFKIRRLTPTECERLQGFPDGWTEGLSDTQRYKCLGNAVTTNVITEIGKKIKERN